MEPAPTLDVPSHQTDLALVRGRWEVREAFRKISSILEAEDCQSARARKTDIPNSPRSTIRRAGRMLERSSIRIRSNTMGAVRLPATIPSGNPNGIRRLLLGSQDGNSRALYRSVATGIARLHSMVTNAVLCLASIGAGFVVFESRSMAASLSLAQVEMSLIGKALRASSSATTGGTSKSKNVSFAIAPAFNCPVLSRLRRDSASFRKIQSSRKSTAHRRGEASL
jgi:hypothetical protein